MAINNWLSLPHEVPTSCTESEMLPTSGLIGNPSRRESSVWGQQNQRVRDLKVAATTSWPRALKLANEADWTCRNPSTTRPPGILGCSAFELLKVVMCLQCIGDGVILRERQSGRDTANKLLENMLSFRDVNATETRVGGRE